MDNFQIIELFAFAIMCITIVTPVIKLNSTVTELRCAVQELRSLLHTSESEIVDLKERVNVLEDWKIKMQTEHERNHKRS